MATLLLVWLGLLLANPLVAAPGAAVGVEIVTPRAARVSLGAGDALGERMFGRALHRRRILRRAIPAHQVVNTPRRIDLRQWLRVHGTVLR